MKGAVTNDGSARSNEDGEQRAGVYGGSAPKLSARVIHGKGGALISRRSHNERCPDCKQTVGTMLAALFGRVEVNWDLNLPSRLEEYLNTSLAQILVSVHEALQKHRGFDRFVRSSKLPRVDYFIPGQNLIVEFDESQHFTKPRDIALSLYPNGEEFGFSVKKWRVLCQELDKRDNDPPYRDEQRAWYDTLRDFVPRLSEAGQTVRLYARSMIWCSLNPGSQSDLRTFQRIIMNMRGGQ